MARVTVEDCIDKVDNRFDLVLLAAHRARMISSGSQLTVDRDNDKNPVGSLREIVDSTISPEDLREELVHSLQKFVGVDDPEPDTVPLNGSAGPLKSLESIFAASRPRVGRWMARTVAKVNVSGLTTGAASFESALDIQKRGRSGPRKKAVIRWRSGAAAPGRCRPQPSRLRWRRRRRSRRSRKRRARA